MIEGGEKEREREPTVFIANPSDTFPRRAHCSCAGNEEAVV
jgi:hypothetical protein